MGNKSMSVMGLFITDEGNNIRYGCHGYSGTVTDDIVPTVRSRIQTNLGYLTRKEATVKKALNIASDFHADLWGSVPILEGDNVLTLKVKLLKRILSQLSQFFPLDIICYYDIPDMVRNLDNPRSKRLRLNKELWSEIADLLDKTKIKMVNVRVSKGQPALVLTERASEVSMLRSCLVGDDGVVSHNFKKYECEPKEYWTTSTPIPDLLSFKEMLMYTNQERRDVIYMVNRGDDLYNIGKTSADCGYMVVRPKKSVDISWLNKVVDIADAVTTDIGYEFAFTAINIASIRSEPKTTLKDMERFGEASLYHKEDKHQFFSIAGKQVLTYSTNTSMMTFGLQFLQHLEDILRMHLKLSYLARRTLKVESPMDITRFFVEDGKPTEDLKNANHFIDIPLGGKVYPVTLDSELPSRNMLVRLCKKNLKVWLYPFKVQGQSMRYAYVCDSDEGSSVSSNWYIL